VDSELLQGFCLKDAWVDPLKGEVRIHGRSSHLPPKAMEVLLCLASQPFTLVTREALTERVWGAGHGSAELLGRAITEIRHALDDHAGEPAFIQTLPRRGYRLIARPDPAGDPRGELTAGKPAAPSLADLGLLDNLKQRGVLETAIAYLVFGWLIIQVVDILFDQLLLPPWAGTFVTVLVIAGFPIAVLLSWFLEFRDGRAVVDHVSPRDARRRRFSRTYLSVIGALAIAAVAVFVYDTNIGLPTAEPPQLAPGAVEVAPPPVQDNSIAVLPFMNLDGSEETGIFAQGLVDDVITRLSRVPGLLVSSRGDAFSLEPNSRSARVRERLRVARYVEGSVQMSGERIRIIVQLIDSATGFHELSRSFDRPREDFFDIRDEITELTVANLRVALPPDTRNLAALAAEDPSLDVYVLYRRGVEAARQLGGDLSPNFALSYFNDALAIDPDYAAAHAGKCSVLVNAYPLTDDAHYIELAESSCARALELNPNLDVVHVALGELYAATGRYDAAETAYRRALQLDPKSVAALTGAGEVHLLQKKPDEAEASFRRAIGLHPGDWSAYNALGWFLFRSGRYAEAAEQYGYVVALDDRNMIGFRNLGAARMLAGDFEAAAPAFQRALEIQPSPLAYSNLGLLYYYMGRLDEAVAAHRQAVELAPKDHLAWSNLGDALWIDGRHDEAHEAFATARELAWGALQVNPNDPGYLMDLAWITAMLDKPAEARRLIDRARALAPSEPYVYYYDGLILQRNGDSNGAVRAFETAVAEGYSRKMLAADPQLLSLRSHPDFAKVIDAVEAR
jgi:tetratricopeptide (TPR) repeat protein/DNA-binding winged helix-turn-helix (wHTH) protein